MTGKSFRGCIMYCLNDKIKQYKMEAIFKDRAEVLMYNKCFGNARELIQQFNEIRALNPKLAKPVLHVTLSLAEGESLDQNKLITISESCSKDLGFENNQYVSILHKDTNHQHVHIIANKIGFDKKTVNDSNNFRKMADFCRKIEVQYNLQKVLSPKKFLPKESRDQQRIDKRKMNIKSVVVDAIWKAKSFDHFIKLVETKGYKVIKGRGISFMDPQKVKVKGSEIGYSLQKIESQIRRLNNIKINSQNQPNSINKKNDVPQNLVNKNEHLNQTNLEFINSIRKNFEKTFFELITPIERFENVDKVFLRKKKKRKMYF